MDLIGIPAALIVAAIWEWRSPTPGTRRYWRRHLST